MNWIFITLLSAVLLAVHEIFSKSLLNKEIKPLQLVFVNSGIMFISALLLFNNKINIKLDLIDFGLIFFKVILLQTYLLIYFTLLQKNETSKVDPLNNLSPILLLILSAFLLGEKASFFAISGIFVIIFGTYYLEVILGNHHRKKPHTNHFNFLKTKNVKFFFKVFLMLLAISFCAIVDKILLSRINVNTNIFFTYFLSFIIFSFYFLSTKQLKQNLKTFIYHPNIYISGIFLFVSTFLILQAISLPDSFVSLVIPLRRTSTMMTAFFAGFMFHESHFMKKILAILIMLLGVFMMAF